MVNGAESPTKTKEKLKTSPVRTPALLRCVPIRVAFFSYLFSSFHLLSSEQEDRILIFHG